MYFFLKVYFISTAEVDPVTLAFVCFGTVDFNGTPKK